MAIFPELALSGYAIDDLLLQDTLLDEVEAAVDELVAATADLLPVVVVGAPLRARHPAAQLRRGRPPGPGARRRAQVLPADLPRVLRAPLDFAPGDDRRGSCDQAGRARTCRSAPTWSSRRPTCPGSVCTSRSARTCGCRSRRVPRPRWPARPCSPTCRAARSPWLAPRTGGCWSARRARAATRRTSTPPRGRASRPPTCRGTARRWSTSAATCWPSPSGSPTGRGAASPTSTSTGSARSGCGRAPSTTTVAPTTSAPGSSASSSWSSTRPSATSGCAARSTGSRSCPTTPRGWRWTATRPTTSRWPGWSSGCTRSGSRRSSSASAAGSTRPTR